MTDHIDVTQFESTHMNVILVKTIGSGPWKIELFEDSDSGDYFAKGPFARWDAICYVRLEKVKSNEDVAVWIKQMEDNF